MLKIDLTSEPGGVKVNWRVGEGLSLHRRDGSLILKINAPYADERAIMTAAHALNFMFGKRHDSNARTKTASNSDSGNSMGDGAKA